MLPHPMLPRRPFHFVRHGETEWNRLGRFQGQTDIPLNALGVAQAEALRPKLANLRLAAIAASPLARARHTAEILNRDLRLPIQFIDALMEFDVGPYAGMDHGGPWLAEWRRGALIPGVECLADFAMRVAGGIRAATALEGPILIVAHGGLIWALEHLLGLPGALDIRNTELLHFQPPSPMQDGAVQEFWRIDLVHAPA